MKKNLTSALLGALLFSTFLISACKKELYVSEEINKEGQKRRMDLLNKNKVELQKIDFSQFKTMVNQKALGTLKNELISEKNITQQKVSSVDTEIKGYQIDKTSVTILKANGHTSYIFKIKQLFPHAITFRNLTIDESVNGTIAFITAYTPTQNWIKKRAIDGHTKFEGKIDITLLDLKNTKLLDFANVNSVAINTKTSSLKPTHKVSSTSYQCTTITIYDIVAYTCRAGVHMPWDSGCSFTGSDAAGYTLEAGTPQTSCIQVEGSGNEGGTTPQTLGNYNPCNEDGTPKQPGDIGYQEPSTTIDDNPCDSATFDPENPKDKYQLINVLDSISLKSRLNCFKIIPNQGASYSVTIYSDIPVNGNPNNLTDYALGVGHSFISISKTNGSNSITQTFGFYPQNKNKATSHTPVPSQISDNSGFSYDAFFTMPNITEQNFNTLLATALSLSSRQYEIDGFNCTAFVLGVFNSIRPNNPLSVAPSIFTSFNPLYPPSPIIKNYGVTPNGLYKKINEIQNNNTAVIGQGYGLWSNCK